MRRQTGLEARRYFKTFSSYKIHPFATIQVMLQLSPTDTPTLKEGAELMRTALILIVLCTMCGCSYPIAQEEVSSFDADTLIKETRTSYKGQLGDVDYQPSYSEDDDYITFFKGTNPRSFRVSRVGDHILVVFCKGSVSLAQPIFKRSRKPNLIDIDVELNCE
jgi:hypothetical protein